MIAATMLLTAALAAQCTTDLPGPECPGPGVRHEMVGVIDGQKVLFKGWHDAEGHRRYQPGEDPALDARVATRHSKLVGGVLDFGVELPAKPVVGSGPRLRTNDYEFGEGWNTAQEQRPCPGPGPCPNPTPGPNPGPTPPVPPFAFPLVYILAAALGAAAFFVFLGAMLVGLLPRKG
jgi:hypothetical protein